VRAGGGAVINIGGLTGHKGATDRVHVVTAKAGLAGMTKALALDLAPHGITVNCVVPGTIDTVRGLPGAPVRPEHRRSLPPAGRRGSRGKSRRWSACCADPTRATSPDSRSMSTAAD
jgi:3-oxoacyl-[acyl-carrier protein] reductase